MMLSSILAIALAGCNTVTPDAIRAQQASWDGNAQNSGVVALLPDHSATVTAHWRDRYNAMVRTYGTSFLPALTVDQGITLNVDGTFHATAQALMDFGKLNRLRKAPR
jgi:hypothetical protein